MKVLFLQYHPSESVCAPKTDYRTMTFCTNTENGFGPHWKVSKDYWDQLSRAQERKGKSSYFGPNTSVSKQVKWRKEASECSFLCSTEILSIHFRFISSHLSWSHAGHVNLMILYARTGWLVEASASEHRMGGMVSAWIPHFPSVTSQGEVFFPRLQTLI